MKLCEHCIEAIRSHGEKVIVLDIVEDSEEMACEWCEEDGETLYECELR